MTLAIDKPKQETPTTSREVREVYEDRYADLEEDMQTRGGRGPARRHPNNSSARN